MTNNTQDGRYLQLKQIRDEVVNLTSSPLYPTRVKPVIGEGNHYAQIMFIGEAPGEKESLQGRPFCGASGKFLDGLLESIQLKREDVYITNIVKDRPPKNRDPLPEEIDLYSPFLDRQIEIIQPKVIATLGRFSMNYIMTKFHLWESPLPISKIHGQIFKGKTSYGEIAVVPLYHPAVALYNGSNKATLYKDFEIIKTFLEKE